MDDSDRLSALRHELRGRLGNERYELWLGSQTSLELEAQALRVRCTSKAEVQWLKRKLGAALAECAARILGNNVEIAFEWAGETQRTLDFNACNGAEKGSGNPEAVVVANGDGGVRGGAEPGWLGYVNGNGVNGDGAPRVRYSFADFVVGSANRLAVQAAREVAQQPGRFSPLLLYGGAGSGKTHLLNAVAQHARRSRSRVRVLQLTAEQFTSQFLQALEGRALPGFRQKMRTLDVLLIDDVHFLAGKKATLEELLYTVDALHARGGQVALVSDRPAAELQSVSADLASRISAGLAVALDPPDYATRVGIVRSMAQRMQLPLEDAVVEMVAQRVVGSGRMLSGAINRLVAASMAVSKPITVELAESALTDFCRQHSPQVRLTDIQRAVCDVFGVEAASLKSQRKTRAIAEPRMLAMWLARRYTRAALSEIGDFFGRRSHSTVVSAQKKFDKLISAHGEMVVGDQVCQVEEAVRRIEAKLRTA
jgi:chromosomal replication initiator protein